MVIQTQSGKFSRSILLPKEADPKNAKCTFENGVLRVVFSRLPPAELEGTDIAIEG